MKSSSPAQVLTAMFVTAEFSDWARAICICRGSLENYYRCPKTQAFGYMLGWRKWGGPK